MDNNNDYNNDDNNNNNNNNEMCILNNICPWIIFESYKVLTLLTPGEGLQSTTTAEQSWS